jgi:hypothetical protein
MRLSFLVIGSEHVSTVLPDSDPVCARTQCCGLESGIRVVERTSSARLTPC